MPRLTKEQRQMYQDFSLEFDACCACGWPYATLHKHRQWMISRLENAHIIGGPGREADRRDIIRLCNGCHRLSHGERIRMRDSSLLPSLELAHLCWMKYHYDHEYWDRSYLNTLRPKRVPKIKKIPQWFLDQRTFRFPYAEHKKA